MGGWYIAQGCIINPILKTEWRRSVWLWVPINRRHGDTAPVFPYTDKLGKYFAVLTVFGPQQKALLTLVQLLRN